MAPFECCAQRPLSLRQIDRAAHKQRERLVETPQQSGGREKLRPRRCEFDCEREVVQASTHGRDRLVDGDVTSSGCRAADEELGRRLVRQRLDGQFAFDAQVQRCARSSQHDDLAHDELGDDGGDSLQMLEVVEHEQHASRGEPAGDVVVRLQPHRFRDGRPHCGGVAQRGKRDEERPVTELFRELRRRLQRQPRLPRPTRPAQGQESYPVGDESADFGQLPLAAENRPRRDGEVDPSERPERREVTAPELVDTFGRQEVLESVLTEVAKVTVDERCRRLRHEYLSAVAGRCDTRSTMDVDADIALVGEERRPRVQTDAHADRAERE